MIDSLNQACSDKGVAHDFRRKTASQLLRSNMKGIRNVYHDLAVPWHWGNKVGQDILRLELLHKIVVSQKRDSQEDHLGLTSVLNGLGKDAGTEFFRQRRKRLRSTGVCDCDFDILTCEGAGQRAANFAGTNNSVIHKESPVSQRCCALLR